MGFSSCGYSPDHKGDGEVYAVCLWCKREIVYDALSLGLELVSLPLVFTITRATLSIQNFIDFVLG